MILYRELELAYIRVPGTASSLFVESMGKDSGERYEWADGKHHLPEGHDMYHHDNDHPLLSQCNWAIPDGFRVVGFMRNPFDWIVHAHETSRNNARTVYGCSEENTDFEHFLRNAWTQSDWLSIDGEIAAEVWKMEDMPRFFEEMGQEMAGELTGERPSMPLTDEHERIIRERCPFECALYEV